MQNKLTPQQGILFTLYNNFTSFYANGQEFNTNDVIAIPLRGNMTSHNLIDNSNIYKNIEKQYFSIVGDIENIVKAKYGNKQNIPMLETREQAITLYDELKSQNHSICKKFDKLVEKLENNKKQTDNLYAFVKQAKTHNKGKEFTDENVFKKFLDSNKSDIAKLGSKRQLMNISNAFIKIESEAKDFLMALLINYLLRKLSKKILFLNLLRK